MDIVIFCAAGLFVAVSGLVALIVAVRRREGPDVPMVVVAATSMCGGGLAVVVSLFAFLRPH